MNPTFCFVGHETVGSYVSRRLDPLGWKRVDDAGKATIVFTYCTSASALEDAYFDSEGLVKRAGRDALLVDLSPSTPSFAREVSAVATVNDLHAVEAPLCVIDPTLPDAFSSPDNVMCYVAGEDDDVDEVIDVLETLFGSVERTGASGTAQLAKAARTVQVTALIASSVEADALMRATRVGLVSREAPDTPIPCVTREGMSMLAAAQSDAFEGTFTVEMLMGEVAAALAAAEDVNLILPQLESSMHLLEIIAVIGGVDKSPAALSLAYREEAESASQGLDWTRAENLFEDYTSGHDLDHGHGYEDEDFGIYGGFGGYSAN